MKQLIYILGDIHGDWKKLNKFIKNEIKSLEIDPKEETEIICLQCGDFGIWKSKDIGNLPILNKMDGIKDGYIKIYFADGNHENHDVLDALETRNPLDEFIEVSEGIYFATFGSVLTLADETTVLFAGGASSIDKEQRTPGITWWAQEDIDSEDMLMLPDRHIDWVISHAAPRRFPIQVGAEKSSETTRDKLDSILDKYNPKQWFFGHYHHMCSGIEGDTRWRGLGETRQHISQWVYQCEDIISSRPNIHTYFMKMADVAAERATCARRKVGAVAVRDKHVLATGYNGAPAGVPHCTKDTCLRILQNIPSGERHEICLAGDTVIKLLDGTYAPIESLVGKDPFWVYSVDTTTGAIVPAQAHSARMTGYRDDIVEILFDNDKTLRCTKDHRIMMRDGTYKEAGDLIPGDSLMPLYYNFRWNNGYECVSNTVQARKESMQDSYISTTRSTPTHRLVYRYIHNDTPFKISDIVHHIDGNPKNNTPDNLEIMSRGAHTLHHMDKRGGMHFISQFGAKGYAAYKAVLEADASAREKKSELGRRNMSKNWRNPDFIKRHIARSKISGKKIAQLTNSDPVHIATRRKGIIRKGLSFLLFKLEPHTKLTEKNYDSIRALHVIPLKSCKEPGGFILLPMLKTILKYYPTLDSAIQDCKGYNHKVRAVKHLNINIPVFDITVPEFENFAVDLGDNSAIFVHNCRASHAEMNVIAQAAMHGVSLKGATLYCTTQPCSMCTKLIINSGIVKVFCKESYNDPLSIQLLKEAGVELIHM